MILRAVILVEDEFDLILFNAVSGIGYFNSDAFWRVDLPQENLSVFLGGVVDGVVNQIANDTFNFALIAIYHAGSIRRKMQVISHLLRNTLIAVGNFLHLHCNVKFRALQFLRAAFQLGKIQHVVDQL